MAAAAGAPQGAPLPPQPQMSSESPSMLYGGGTSFNPPPPGVGLLPNPAYPPQMPFNPQTGLPFTGISQQTFPFLPPVCILTFFRPMEFSIKIHTIKSGCTYLCIYPNKFSEKAIKIDLVG